MNSIELLVIQSTTLNVLSVTLCAAIAGAGSMTLYRWVSPQKKLKRLQESLKDAQQRMSGYDGEFAGLWDLVKENIQLAMKRVGWSLGPSMVAGMPLILLFVAIDFRHDKLIQGHEYNIRATEIVGPPRGFVDENGQSELSKTREPTKAVSIDYVPLGPSWMRSWIFLFIVASTISALVVKFKQGAI